MILGTKMPETHDQKGLVLEFKITVYLCAILDPSYYFGLGQVNRNTATSFSSDSFPRIACHIYSVCLLSHRWSYIIMKLLRNTDLEKFKLIKKCL